MLAASLHDVNLGYPDHPDIVRGASLDVRQGETIAILGPSGGGKTTLLKALAGLLTPRRGTLQVLGCPAGQPPPPGSVGYVPQRLGLVRHATVLQNALQGALHETPRWRSLMGRPDPAALERAQAALTALGLDGLQDQVVHRLSGGQQRRVATARALVQRPQLLLADEFLGELDPATVNTVLDAVDRLQGETGMAMVLVEHQLDQAMRVADRIFQLKAGLLTEAIDLRGGA